MADTQKQDSEEPAAAAEVAAVVPAKKPKQTFAVTVEPGSFEAEHHYYTKVINSQIHPLVSHFMNLTTKQLVSRYCHLYPSVDKAALEKLLSYEPQYFRWSGADLFCTTTETGIKKMVIVETNSSPSGQKSCPWTSEYDEGGGYRVLIERTFKPLLLKLAAENPLPEGRLAVIFDKNHMEASGYAAMMAEVFEEEVLLVPWYNGDETPSCRWTKDLILEVKDASDVWHPVRAAFRYVTQKPWRRLPVSGARTLILNPVIVCLAGGRNKLMAAKAYELFNHSEEAHQSGLQILTPETIRDVSKAEIPMWVKSFGGKAVIKVPYGNAGQGVYTITSADELARFMEEDDDSYDQYIVQSLVGNYHWSSVSRQGQLFHVGTVPDRSGRIYVADLRMMVHYDYTKKVYRPLALYARRARKPLVDELVDGASSWDILGTNLSVKLEENSWDTETNRLMIFDRRDFNKLGFSTDDLLNAYVQTIMCTVAIDRMARRLCPGGDWDADMFESLNKDASLMAEIMRTAAESVSK
eukprot:CAMPEP_0177652588 /NCGR_PEP_ID=MMETSP0447-20121125/13219_1 /TAXON_ID=0 /ORGANISM="Stygamoeba regulata, Strain BSH-02190019" /LENGTH=523 /DNA_ID=CAMNT_0019155861 /DNA_START=84 /DNA_END=1655 /DNA_ORIENTATION=+